MELQLAEVQRALSKLANHYPEAGYNGKTLISLAADWFDLLSEEKVTQKQFSAGVRHAVKTCRFFPKLADVLEGVRSYREAPTRISGTMTLRIEADTATAENLTAEERARNKERVRLITEALAGRMSMEDAEREVARMGHISEFSVPCNQEQGEA